MAGYVYARLGRKMLISSSSDLCPQGHFSSSFPSLKVKSRRLRFPRPFALCPVVTREGRTFDKHTILIFWKERRRMGIRPPPFQPYSSSFLASRSSLTFVSAAAFSDSAKEGGSKFGYGICQLLAVGRCLQSLTTVSAVESHLRQSPKRRGRG